MATLHFICGKAGWGKTTLARELGRTLPALVIGPLVVEALRLGTSVVFDFGGNTVKSRTWVRSLFEEARADHGPASFGATSPTSCSTR